MKRLFSVILSLALLLVFPQALSAEKISINPDDVQTISFRTFPSNPKMEGEATNRRIIRYVAGVLNSFTLTPDSTDLSGTGGFAQELTIRYKDETEQKYTLYGQYFYTPTGQYVLDSQQAEEFQKIYNIVKGNIPYNALPELKLYINDELQQCTIFENRFSSLPKSTKDFVPLRACLEAMGHTVEWQEPGTVIIRTPENREIQMQIGEETISYTSRVPMEYREINDSIYYPLYEFPHLVDCQIYRDGNTIYLDSGAYYKEKHTVYKNIGRNVNVNTYINNIKINTPVFYNTTVPKIEGDTLGYFVLLRPVFEALNEAVAFIEPNIIQVTQGESTYTFRAKMFISGEEELMFADGEEDCYIIDGKTYIPFSKIRYVIQGSLKQQDGTNMYLYTDDFIRTDIPATLQDAYAMLDEMLNQEDIHFIKDCTEDELLEMHFGLGMWIRNHWIYPSNDRIAKVFLDKGIEHPDAMSSYIIYGYKLYLNGMPCEIHNLI